MILEIWVKFGRMFKSQQSLISWMISLCLWHLDSTGRRWNGWKFALVQLAIPSMLQVDPVPGDQGWSQWGNKKLRNQMESRLLYVVVIFLKIRTVGFPVHAMHPDLYVNVPEHRKPPKCSFGAVDLHCLPCQIRLFLYLQPGLSRSKGGFGIFGSSKCI